MFDICLIRVSRICQTCNTKRSVIVAEDKDLLLKSGKVYQMFVLTTDDSTNRSVYLCNY